MKTIDNLEAWEVLVVAARTRSLSRTAIVLDLDLPKVSRLLHNLEEELGFALFDKSHRRRAVPNSSSPSNLLSPVFAIWKSSPAII